MSSWNLAMEDNTCINKVKLCNNYHDCPKGSDENELCEHKSCGKNQHQCMSETKCIRFDLRCDGSPHCSDFSDEINCTCQTDRNMAVCPVPHGTCGSNCILNVWLCDGYPDCPKSSDEMNCFSQKKTRSMHK